MSDSWHFRIRAERDPFLGPGISLFAAQRKGAGLFVAQEVEFKGPHPEGQIVHPFLRLAPEDGQALMDSLWDCGLRPSEGSGSAGSLAATERHLEDMRALVFKLPARDIRK